MEVNNGELREETKEATIRPCSVPIALLSKEDVAKANNSKVGAFATAPVWGWVMTRSN